VNILLAEDDIDAAVMYCAILESQGHKVTKSFNGQECLDTYSATAAEWRAKGKKTEAPYDVVLLDYKMPLMNGLQTAKEIMMRVPEQRIVFASAFAQETIVDSVRELKRLVQVIQKPFDPELLVRVVEDKSMEVKIQDLNAQIKKTENIDSAGIGMLHKQLQQLQDHRL
jgi:CheY-like chemotaxis protein